jgi:hypothetical protein
MCVTSTGVLRMQTMWSKTYDKSSLQIRVFHFSLYTCETEMSVATPDLLKGVVDVAYIDRRIVRANARHFFPALCFASKKSAMPARSPAVLGGFTSGNDDENNARGRRLFCNGTDGGNGDGDGNKNDVECDGDDNDGNGDGNLNRDNNGDVDADVNSRFRLVAASAEAIGKNFGFLGSLMRLTLSYHVDDDDSDVGDDDGGSGNDSGKKVQQQRNVHTVSLIVKCARPTPDFDTQKYRLNFRECVFYRAIGSGGRGENDKLFADLPALTAATNLNDDIEADGEEDVSGSHDDAVALSTNLSDDTDADCMEDVSGSHDDAVALSRAVAAAAAAGRHLQGHVPRCYLAWADAGTYSDMFVFSFL